jgi:hypothetical protein
VSARAVGVLIGLLVTVSASPRAERPAAAGLASANGVRHHYTMAGRIRPLLFWIGKDDVGDAVIAMKRDADGAAYSMLIGSDPDRAPRRINRWGYISEEIRGGEATLIGLMTQSDEGSISEAEANLRSQNGDRTFNVIRTSVADDQARSVVTSVVAPAAYTFQQVDVLLGLTAGGGRNGTPRVVRLPAGTRPGFLTALADIVHGQVTQWRTSHSVSAGADLTYVYYGKLYHLRAVRSHAIANLRAGGAVYEHAIASHFQIENRDGELTDFSITFAADGPLVETVLSATYRPRWWLEIELTLDDTKPAQGPVLAGTP